MKDYQIFEHTADIGLKVRGKDLKKLFANAALAMFDIIAERKPKINPSINSGLTLSEAEWVKNQKLKTKKIIVQQKADNLEELFVNWLNELLSLSATKELIFSDFKINKLNEENLQATAVGSDVGNYKINTEIKAATYHELRIEKTKSDWQARVIFDV